MHLMVIAVVPEGANVMTYFFDRKLGSESEVRLASGTVHVRGTKMPPQRIRDRSIATNHRIGVIYAALRHRQRILPQGPYSRWYPFDSKGIKLIAGSTPRPSSPLDNPRLSLIFFQTKLQFHNNPFS